MTRLDTATRDRLTVAIIEDETLDEDEITSLLRSVENVPDGTSLDVEIPNGTDGTNDIERVALAYDYYFGCHFGCH